LAHLCLYLEFKMDFEQTKWATENVYY